MKPLHRPLLAVAAALALTGCTIGTPAAPAGSTGSTGRTAAAAGSTAPSTTASRDNGAAAAGVDDTNPPKPVGSIQIACQAGFPFSKVTIGVLGVQRRDRLAVATFVLTGTRDPAVPLPSGTFTHSEYSLYHCATGAWDPQLVDGANLLLYRPVDPTRSGAARMSSDALGTEVSEQPTYLYAVFPAPKPGVTNVDVVIGAGAVQAVALT